MAIFVVLGLGDAIALGNRIKEKFPEDHCAIEADKWFVAADGVTAANVASSLGMTTTENILGIVVDCWRLQWSGISRYLGVAQGEGDEIRWLENNKEARVAQRFPQISL